MFSKSICVVPVVVVLSLAAPAIATLAEWEDTVALESLNFFATYIADGVYDIGEYGGEQTYEFVVKSIPYSDPKSMALIGRRDFGETWVGLKYDQWSWAGSRDEVYGATVFYIKDYYFSKDGIDIKNEPGVDTHLVFVSSESLGKCELYVNGVYRASVDTAISISGLVGIGYAAKKSDGTEYFDNFEGDIYGVAIYDAALSADEILAHSYAYFPPEITLARMALFIIDQVNSGNIVPELQVSLLAKINGALAALERGNPNDAKVSMNDLSALINQVEAQTDKKITLEAATELIRRVNAIKAALGG